MTASRFIRGTKARVLFSLFAVFLVTGVIVCFNSILTDLNESKKANELCHQQDESLSTQLQVVTDYKQRLETSIKTEKAAHTHALSQLENKYNEEKSKNEKSMVDANLRFNSLQQHFNLLQSQHEDYKEECANTQKEHLNEINDLQLKLKELQEQLKIITNARDGLKISHSQLQMEKENLERIVKNDSRLFELQNTNQKLQNELDELHKICSADTAAIPAPENPVDDEKRSSKSSLNAVSSPKPRVTPESLRAVQPLPQPTVTPLSLNLSRISSSPSSTKKLPEGVVPMPIKAVENEEKKIPQDETLNNRYINQINDQINHDKTKDIKMDVDDDKENGAHEVYDHLNDPLALNNNEPLNNNLNDIGKIVNRNEKVKNKNYPEGDEKDIPNDVQLGENDMDEYDDDEYRDNIARQRDPAVRN